MTWRRVPEAFENDNRLSARRTWNLPSRDEALAPHWSLPPWMENHTGENTGDAGQHFAVNHGSANVLQNLHERRSESTPQTARAIGGTWLPRNC
jgi:hypothetical protein